MEAIYLEKPRQVRVEDLKVPERKAREIMITVRSLGICGSDIGAYMGVNPLVSYPRIIGHEAAGEIVEVDADETEFAVGDKVVLEPYIYCGECYPCKNGRTNCCENLTVIGVHIDGAMRRQVSHPRRLVHKIPKDASWERMAMAEPLTISIHAVHRGAVKSGEHVVINGSGPIGLLAAQYAMHLGAVPIMSDPVEERLAFARKLGVRHTVNPAAGDAAEKIKAITGGRMAEVVIEASGNAAAIRASIDYVAYAGRIVLVGWPKKEIELPTALFTKKELDVRGSRNSYQEFPESIALIAAGKIDVEAVISNVIRFEEIPRYVEDIAARPGDFLKVVALLGGE